MKLIFIFQQDLQHPNEFIRGSTLRFLCKLREPELLEPLVPAILSCLEHRHAYVRRNAVLAVAAIYKRYTLFHQSKSSVSFIP
jgi:coatomer subunit beta